MSKKNNTAIKQNILEAEKLSKAIKEGTKKTLSNIMNEAINKMIAESEEDGDEDSYEVEDVETETETSDVDTEENDTEASEDAEVETEEDPETEETEEAEDVEDGEEGDEADIEDYKIGNDTYDLTTEEDPEKYIKIYNKLSDDDDIMIRRTEDGKIEMSDGETGAEYVIELNPDEMPDDLEFEGMGNEDDINGEYEFDAEEEIGGDDFEDEGGEDYIEFETEGDDYSTEDGEDGYEADFEDEEEDELLSEDEINAFINDYQKNVIPGLKNHEPADKSSTYSMDAGAPKGTERPYPGQKDGKGEPFEKTIEEGAMTVSSQSVAKTTHTPTSEPRSKNARQVKKLVHAGGEYVNEGLERKILAKAREIEKQNKLYESALDKVKKSLREAAILNVTLTQALKLMVENTTTYEEKKSIVERFKNVKTINESKTLYDTIDRELKTNAKSNVVLEHDLSVKGGVLNETKMYQKDLSDNPAISLMNRIDNLYKY